MSAIRRWTLLLMPYGRVGSNMMMDILLQSRKVAGFNEPFTVIRNKNPDANGPTLWELQRRWLEDNIVRNETGKKIVVNLAASTIADVEAFKSYLPACNIIVVDRKSVVQTIISCARGKALAEHRLKETGRATWALRDGESFEAKPTVQKQDFHDYLQSIVRGRAVCAAIEKQFPVFRYYYEDILMDLDGVIIDLIQRCDLDWYNYRVKHKKLSPGTVSDVVANPSDIHRWARDAKIQ